MAEDVWRYDGAEARLAQGSTIGVPTIALEGNATARHTRTQILCPQVLR